MAVSRPCLLEPCLGVAPWLTSAVQVRRLQNLAQQRGRRQSLPRCLIPHDLSKLRALNASHVCKFAFGLKSAWCLHCCDEPACRHQLEDQAKDALNRAVATRLWRLYPRSPSKFHERQSVTGHTTYKFQSRSCRGQCRRRCVITWAKGSKTL